MVVDTNKESLNINKLVSEKKEMIFVEGDMIVPDSKPDILNTINTSGNIWHITSNVIQVTIITSPFSVFCKCLTPITY